MRIVGVILLILAVGLASLGGYLFWVRLDNQLVFSIGVTNPIEGVKDAAEKAPAKAARDAAEKAAAEKAAAKVEKDRAEKAAAKAAAGEALATRDELAKIKVKGRQIEQLPKGNIVLDGPRTMKVSETRTVHANVGVNVPFHKLRHWVDPGSQMHEDILAVSSEMIAVLNGSGFKITAVTPEQQSVAEGYPTVWSWDVEAKETGDQVLEATLYALIGDKSRQRIDSYTHKISVSVRELTWSEWLKSFRDEFDAAKAIVLGLGSAVTAVLGWLVLYLDRRRRKALTPVPSETK